MSTVRLHGHPYALSYDAVRHVATWNVLPPPICPECSEYLSQGCADDEPKMSLMAQWAGQYIEPELREAPRTQNLYVECDGCSAIYPIDDAPALSPNREQADGYYEPSIVEDEFGDDRS